MLLIPLSTGISRKSIEFRTSHPPSRNILTFSHSCRFCTLCDTIGSYRLHACQYPSDPSGSLSAGHWTVDREPTTVRGGGVSQHSLLSKKISQGLGPCILVCISLWQKKLLSKWLSFHPSPSVATYESAALWVGGENCWPSLTGNNLFFIVFSPPMTN